MPETIMSWNIEWFDRLFDDHNEPILDDPEKKKRNDAIAEVLGHIDPALVGVVEGPASTIANPTGTVDCLRNFAAHYGLNLTEALLGYRSKGVQEIAVWFDPNRATAVWNPGGTQGSTVDPPFDGEFRIDTDEDRVDEIHSFYRPPLEADVTAGGQSFKLIVCHNKSKGIQNAGDLLNWDRENRTNRRMLFGQSTWIRRRVDQCLQGGHQVVVMGDINDGAGMDWYEFEHAKSSVELIMGDLFEPDGLLRHQLGRPRWVRSKGEWRPASTSFRDLITGDYVRVLIDFILTSNGIALEAGSHAVWNPWQFPSLTGPISQALKDSSDHHPVTIRLD